jgi:PncC family amidohydrolase
MSINDSDPKKPIEVLIGHALTRQGFTIAIAESATGGMVASRLTDISGSSSYFIGGIVAYSNFIKASILSVPEETLERYGAVSEQTALAMAKGVRHLLQTDIGVSTTGIAGPTGGTKSKPVGLIYVAADFRDSTMVRRAVFSENREENKFEFTQRALEILADLLEI